MNGSFENECAFTAKAVGYSGGSLSPYEMLEMERHLPTCERCMELVTGIRRTRETLARLALLTQMKRQETVAAETVTAAASEVATPDWAVVQQALEECTHSEATPPNLRGALLEAWITTLRRARAEARQKLSEFTRESAESILVSLEYIREFGAVMVNRLVETPGRLVLMSGSEAAQVPTRGEAPKVKVQTRLQNGRLQVVIYGLPSETQKLAVLLVSTGAGASTEPRMGLAEKKNGGCWLAFFDGVKAGEHAVAIQPLSVLE